MSQQQVNPALRDAQTGWQLVFGGGPYTGLKMLEYLIRKGGKTPKGFLQKPKTELSTVMANPADHSITDMEPTWKGKTGRCTSLAVKVVDSLAANKTQGKLVYEWCIYDLGRHRIARCLKTGVVIDSSSTIVGGAFLLPEGQWQRFDKTDASWKFKSGSKSKFESQGNAEGAVKSSSTPISAQEAMIQCLKEVAGSASDSVPTLFRSMGADRIGKFHGLVVWAPNHRAIKLAVNSIEWKAKRIVTIQWAKQKLNKGQPTKELNTDMQGTEADLMICLQTLSEWVVNYGGPNGPSQWAADGIDNFCIVLIAAACELWGYPKLVPAPTATT